MRRALSTFALGTLAASAFGGCKDPAPQKPVAAVASAAPSATVAPLAAFSVPPGTIANSLWLPQFAVSPELGEGLDYLGAAARCATVHLSLCSEPQWTRACAQEPRISSAEAWTASADADRGFVTRGGADCDTRKVVVGSDVSPSRRTMCCSRAVGITSPNHNPAFLVSTSSRMLAFESSLVKHDSSAVRGLLADSITLYGASKTGDAAAKALETLAARARDFWVIHESCEVTTQREEGTWTADCRKMAQQDGQVASVITRYVWSAEGKITSINDPKVLRAFAAP